MEVAGTNVKERMNAKLSRTPSQPTHFRMRIADWGAPNLANLARLDIKAMVTQHDAGN